MKKYNKDFDYIASKFEEEAVKAPESLSEANIVQKLEQAGGENIIRFDEQKRKKHTVRAAVALVACFAVAAVSLFAWDKIGNKDIFIPTPTTATVSGGIRTFTSYEELTDELEELQKRNMYDVYRMTYGASDSVTMANNETSKGTDTDMAATSEENVGGEGGSDGMEQTDASFAQTNKQVDAVDEPDIIKTDAYYIYYASRSDNKIYIWSAENGECEQASVISFGADKSETNEYEYIDEMFLYGDKLIVIGDHDHWYQDVIAYGSEEESVKEDTAEEIEETERVDNYLFMRTYDISDRSKPKQVGEYRQSGRYISSRMIDGTVYLISNYGTEYYILYGSDAQKETFVPCATDAEGEVTKLPIENIGAIENCKDGTYSVIGAVDMDAAKQSSETKALLGASDSIYCNEKNLYLTGYTYELKDEKSYDYDEYTQIIKYAVDGLTIEEQCAAKLKGNLNDQFSLDEYDGNLRVAITEYDWADNSHNRNYLYVFDENLKQIGKLDAFAIGEHIEAVRFMGEIAYVITYETTDPLFIIDLSVPTAPALKGEVKIDGFSTFLTPVDDHTMLGIGYSTKEESWGIVQEGLKLTLFDVSDMAQPKVLDAIEYPRSSSEAQYTHKAIVRNDEKGYFAIPVYQFDGYDYDNAIGNGALVIRVNDDNKLEVENLDTGYWSTRCTYIGDYVYVVNEDATDIHAFEVK